MDSSISNEVHDYSTLMEQYSSLKKDYESVKQCLHESNRQLKVNEALLGEYQGEIEILQNHEKSLQQKLEAKVSCLEETILNLRSNHLQNVTQLESEILSKDKIIEDFKNDIENLKRSTVMDDKANLSPRFSDVFELSNENELLKENFRILEEAFQHLQVQYAQLDQNFQESKEEIIELQETLMTKREELTEKSILINKLSDELATANTELETYKNKPLQEGSKGNSLFAEVDDRRVVLQKTVNDMKSSYLHLKQEHGKHEKIISHLRKENADLRESWKKDLEQIQEDHDAIVDSLNSRLKILEEINERQEKRLNETLKPSGDNLCDEYLFYQDIIESKSAEIQKLERRLSDRTITEHILSMNLSQAHKEMRLMRLNVIELQQQIDENKEKELNAKEEELYRRYTMFDVDVINNETEADENVDIAKSNVKSCLRQTTNIISSDDKNLSIFKTHDDVYTENKENLITNSKTLEAQDSAEISKRKGVKFTEETQSPTSNPVRRRGTKIFVMKKKGDSSDAVTN